MLTLTWHALRTTTVHWHYTGLSCVPPLPPDWCCCCLSCLNCHIHHNIYIYRYYVGLPKSHIWLYASILRLSHAHFHRCTASHFNHCLSLRISFASLSIYSRFLFTLLHNTLETYTYDACALQHTHTRNYNSCRFTSTYFPLHYFLCCTLFASFYLWFIRHSTSSWLTAVLGHIISHHTLTYLVLVVGWLATARTRGASKALAFAIHGRQWTKRIIHNH